MKLLRLAVLEFKPAPEDWRTWNAEFGEVEVQTMQAWDLDGGGLRLLVVAQVLLPKWPELTDGNLVIVPEVPRKQAEEAIEASANIVAVAGRCKRSIFSPIPCVALLPENPDAREWLESTGGFLVQRDVISGATARVEGDVALDSLMDRLDGVALLAEALAHGHPTGRFHEFVRLFERAFGLGPHALVEPLAEFLSGAPHMGCMQPEVEKWLDELRGPATHADRRATFVLEADVRSVVDRMEQAAYEVLFNKEVWRDRSPARRELWNAPTGTSSDSGGVFALQRHQGGSVTAQFLDEFGSYVLDFYFSLRGKLSAEWWSEESSGRHEQEPGSTGHEPAR